MLPHVAKICKDIVAAHNVPLFEWPPFIFLDLSPTLLLYDKWLTALPVPNNEPFLDKCHSIPHASIDALGKVMRRITSQCEANEVVISDIEAQYFLGLTISCLRECTSCLHSAIIVYTHTHKQTFIKFVYSLFLWIQLESENRRKYGFCICIPPRSHYPRSL